MPRKFCCLDSLKEINYEYNPYRWLAYSLAKEYVSIAIQRGNAGSPLGTLPLDSDIEKYFNA